MQKRAHTTRLLASAYRKDRGVMTTPIYGRPLPPRGWTVLTF
jgi:hypothetical protein